MKNTYAVLKSLLRTEKGAMIAAEGKYVFWVDRSANKIDIKHAVEDLYAVHVTNVTTCVVKGKPKRVRSVEGLTMTWKKAVVTLKKGEKIDVAA